MSKKSYPADFEYHYEAVRNHHNSRVASRIKQGHIVHKSTLLKFLCSEKIPDCKFIILLSATPGVKLCSVCRAERKRILEGLPNKDELRNWWLVSH